MKRKVRIIAIIMAMVMVLAVPMNVFAASKPYKDVSVSSVGKEGYNAICYVKRHGGYADVVKGNKFHPNKKMKRWEFLTMLSNFYGDDAVPVSMSDIRHANKAITEKYACKKMVAVAKKAFGMTITWKGGSKKLSRTLASQYLKVFAQFDPAFRPRY